MFSIRTLSVACALAAAGAGSMALAGVVVSSSGPSASQFPAGKKLDDNSRITLKAGDKVTVLTTNGTRVISGAGTHQVGAAGASKRSTFAVLTRQRSSQRVRTGAVRGTGTGEAETRNPNLWFVDVSRSGTMCVTNGTAVRLWRPGSEVETTFVVSQPGAPPPTQVHVPFASGVADAGWDSERLPVTEGATYTITGPGGSPSEVRFTLLDSPPDDPEELAARLIEKGCTAQLDLLTTALS
jgi:hypothetical protein